jgi:RNA-binding protein
MPEDNDSSTSETPRLTSKQRAHLRSLAHDNKTVVHVGKDGLSDAVLTSIKEAFNTRELVKIRILDNANEPPRDMAHAIADRLDGVQVVHTMGWTVTLYRPDPDEPQIELP